MSIKNVKYLLILIVLVIPSQALAITGSGDTTTHTSTRTGPNQTPAGNTGNQQPNRDANKQASEAQLLQKLKERGDKEIARRIAGLNHLMDKINGMSKLTADQKAAFASEVNQNISDLNALKAKIDADTDLQTLKTDIKSIVDSYRIFALVMPQINILGTAERTIEVANKMSTFAGKLQVRITEAEQNGKDVAVLKLALADMQAKITDAQTQATNAEDAVMNLDPSGYPGNRTSLEQGWKDLKTAREDFGAASKDGKKIVEGLKALETGGAGAANAGVV